MTMLLTRFEILHMFRRNLGDLEESNLTFVINKSSTLDVSLGLVSDLHQKVGLAVDHVFEDWLVDAIHKSESCGREYTINSHSTQVVRIGDKEVFLSICQELVENARLSDGIEEVTVPRRVPAYASHPR